MSTKRQKSIFSGLFIVYCQVVLIPFQVCRPKINPVGLMRLLRNNLNLGNEIDMKQKRKGNIGEDLFNATAHNIIWKCLIVASCTFYSHPLKVASPTDHSPND